MKGLLLFFYFSTMVACKTGSNSNHKKMLFCDCYTQIHEKIDIRKSDKHRFINSGLLIFVDSTDLEPVDPAKQVIINEQDKQRSKLYEKSAKKREHITFSKSNNPPSIVDPITHNQTSLLVFGNKLSDKLEQKFNTKTKLLIQLCIHWTGKVTCVKLLRYENLQNKEYSINDIVNELNTINWSELKVIPEKHYHIEVCSSTTLVMGFEK